jgi:hypothetical protein
MKLQTGVNGTAKLKWAAHLQLTPHSMCLLVMLLLILGSGFSTYSQDGPPEGPPPGDFGPPPDGFGPPDHADDF